MKFCTAINCMDGRVQLPVIHYLQKRFDAEYVDAITEPGPNLILAEQKQTDLIASIFSRLQISIEKHHSVGVAVVGHFDCGGNPSGKDEQLIQVKDAVKIIESHYKNVKIIGLWLDENWTVHEL